MDHSRLPTVSLGLLLVFGLCTGSSCAALNQSVELRRPTNVILFLVDDLGWQDTSVPFTAQATGQNLQWRTPNLDALAARGMRFTNAYAAAPVCTPTRTSLLTGRSPGATQITYWSQAKDQDTSANHPTLAPPVWRMNGLDATDVTYPQLLSKSGYRTIHVGKAHFGAKDTFGASPENLGFAVNIAGHYAGQPGSYLGTDNFTGAGRTGNPKANVFWDVPGLESWHGKQAFLTEALAAEACLAIEDAHRDRAPFVMNFAPYAVHTPITANEPLLGHYEQLDPREAKYGTMIESVDNALGELIEKLEQLGIAQDTAIVFTSDNGGLSAHGRGLAPDGTTKNHHNAPLRSGKASAYEGGTRVPMVVWWPGHTQPGTWSHEPVVTYDLFPTLLAMTEVEAPAGVAKQLEGVDLSPLFAGTGELPQRTIFWHQPHQWGASGPGIEPFTAARAGPWKLIYFHAAARLELYNLDTDVGELHNVAPANAALVTELATEMQGWIDERDVQLSRWKATGESVPGPLAIARSEDASAVQRPEDTTGSNPVTGGDQ
jgi:arylsulfatase A-like enzyme